PILSVNGLTGAHFRVGKPREQGAEPTANNLLECSSSNHLVSLRGARAIVGDEGASKQGKSHGSHMPTFADLDTPPPRRFAGLVRGAIFAAPVVAFICGLLLLSIEAFVRSSLMKGSASTRETVARS